MLFRWPKSPETCQDLFVLQPPFNLPVVRVVNHGRSDIGVDSLKRDPSRDCNALEEDERTATRERAEKSAARDAEEMDHDAQNFEGRSRGTEAPMD